MYMKHKLPMILTSILCFAIACSPMYAHHGTQVSYDLNRKIELKGTVTEFKWSNPHVQLYLDVKDEKGSVVHWTIEGNSPFNWARMGWNRNTLKPGDEITIYVYPSKVAGVPSGVVNKVVLANGQEVLKFTGQ